MKRMILLVICFLLCACSKEMTVSKEVVVDNYNPTSSKITLTMVGDALIDEYIYNDAYEEGKYDFNKMFETIKSEFKNSDLMYYNQESILGGSSLGYSGTTKFNTPEEFGRTMINLGFNLVSRANEHTLDVGEAGILNSCNFWNKYPNVLTNGSSCTLDEKENPNIMEMNGIKYTLLNYTTYSPDTIPTKEYYVDIYRDERAYEDISNIIDDVDVLIVAMHWGDGSKSTPSAEQIRISEYLASLGVDIIVGTHPHIVGPIRWIDDTLVIYSLGNFIAGVINVNSVENRIGLLVDIDILKTSNKNNVKVELTNLKSSLIYTYSTNGSGFQVIPFSKLNENILPNYKSIKTKINSIVKYYDNSIVTE